jgi:hypothetical protein
MKVSPLFQTLPRELVRHIRSFIPKFKPQPPKYNGLDRELTRIQKRSPKSLPAMWLYGLEDFVLV